MADPRFLDELAADATAPRTVQRLGSWHLRADPTLPFRRANSTIPFGGEPTDFDVGARIVMVEDFYRTRGLPPRVLIGPWAEPSDLDDRLARRSYSRDAPVEILTVDTMHALAALTAIECTPCRVRDEIDPHWLAKYADGATRGRIEGYRRLFADTTSSRAVVTVDIDGEPAAIGFGVLDRGWVGIFGMATQPDARRRGAARGVLCGLAQWAHDEEANQLYLQVEIDNAAARTLYESVGFVCNHGYHYRVLA